MCSGIGVRSPVQLISPLDVDSDQTRLSVSPFDDPSVDSRPRMGRVEIDTALQLRGDERCASAEGVIAEPEGMDGMAAAVGAKVST